MTQETPTGPRVLGFGKDDNVAAAVEENLRAEGMRATSFTLTDDAAGDQRLVEHLDDGSWDAVVIGGFISGQSPHAPPTPQTTVWFNRVLNLIHERAPSTKLVLVTGPSDVLPAIRRELGTQFGT
jgi:hypothetical protein